jgi:type VI secretion system secreted protein VgrG
VQAQSDVVKVTADKTITVASVTKSVNITAKNHVMLTAQGAYLKLEGGNIMIHGPGTMEFKASMKELAGPQRTPLKLPSLPKSQEIVNAVAVPMYSQRIVTPEIGGLTPEYAGMSFEVWKRGKPVRIASGTLDQNGMSPRLFTDSPEELSILLGDASWNVVAAEDTEPSPYGDLDE